MSNYNLATLQMDLKNPEDAKRLHEEYIQSRTPMWKEEAMPSVVAREVSGLTTAKIGEMIGTSAKVIKKFEKGEPIERSKMVAQSYATALNLIYSKKFGITSDNLNKLYLPVELLEHLVSLSGKLGISLIENAVNSANRLYKFNWTLNIDKFSTKPINEKTMAVYDEDCGNYFYIFPKSS